MAEEIHEPIFDQIRAEPDREKRLAMAADYAINQLGGVEARLIADHDEGNKEHESASLWVELAREALKLAFYGSSSSQNTEAGRTDGS